MRLEWTTRSARGFLRVLALLLPVACAPAPMPDATSSSGGLSLPTESELSNPSLTRQWADRVTSNDPRVRADAVTKLAQGGERSLPLLRRFLASHDPDLRQAGFEIAHRIG